MKVLKNVSDELWLGFLFLLVAIFVFAVNTEYIIISGVFAFVGIFLLIVDNIKKTQKASSGNNKRDARRAAKK